MIDTDLSVFGRFWSLGYKRLVPIIPPDAPISEGSMLFKRVGTNQDGRGKTPGTMGRDGKWFSFDWTPYEADQSDLQRWAAMRAGVGIKTGNGLIAIDADTLDTRHAETVRDIVAKHCGRLPVRVGQHPKAIYLCRVSEPYRYTRVDFGENKPPERVEILSDGRQFVASGTHPKTGKPYAWPREIVPFDELPVFSPAQLDALMQDLRAALPAASQIIKEGADTKVDQRALAGDPETIRRAVAAIPNTSQNFGTREAYRDMGYAIKAALPDDPELAFTLFSDWCARWEDGENDPLVVEADWRRMKPPFRRGATWLYETAERVGRGFGLSDVWFEPVGDAAGDLPEMGLNALKRDAEAAAPPPIHATPYGFPDPAAIPPRQWVYGTHYVRKFVSATVAPSGVGKSSLEIVEALAMASGKPLLGVTPRGQFRVWMWNGEDPRDELERRIAAAMMHYGLTPSDIGDRLFIDSGREMEIVLATDTRDGATIAAPVVSGLLGAMRANRIDVLQIDPFVSTHRVSENDNGAIDLVTKQWARIADTTGAAVELVHHVRKLNGGEVTVEDSRGAVALLATSRSARALTKMTAKEALALGFEDGRSRLFRFGDGKNNLALPAGGSTDWFELRSVALGNGSKRLKEGGDGDGAAGLLEGDSVGVVTRWRAGSGADGDGGLGLAGVSDSRRDTALALLRGGDWWRRDVRAGDAWAGSAIGTAYGLDVGDAAGKAQARSILAGWIASGLVREVTRLDSKRMPRVYIEVTGNAENAAPASAFSVFD